MQIVKQLDLVKANRFFDEFVVRIDESRLFEDVTMIECNVVEGDFFETDSGNIVPALPTDKDVFHSKAISFKYSDHAQSYHHIVREAEWYNARSKQLTELDALEIVKARNILNSQIVSLI